MNGSGGSLPIPRPDCTAESKTNPSMFKNRNNVDFQSQNSFISLLPSGQYRLPIQVPSAAWRSVGYENKAAVADP
jgi:hypothetical protein